MFELETNLKNVLAQTEDIILFTEELLKKAIEYKVSDIHIEPYEKYYRIRFRRDGILYPMGNFSHEVGNRLNTRLKVLAKLDISEKRFPQDGRLQLNQKDIRMNTCPTLFGEKSVLRLLDCNEILLDLNRLGFTEKQYLTFLKEIKNPQGLILVTGPTGSGKTITLYAALNYLNNPEKNISTVEDPIEIKLEGINQVNIHSKIGLEFATVLRTFLRQDPDILMVGEIRDKETAEIAIQAAQTGHLVISTLHTNSALETLNRFKSMGIETYNIINSISLIISQRLLRKLCNFCKTQELLTSTFHAVGCDRCWNGYQGRTGIFEFLPMNHAIKQLIFSKSSDIKICNETSRQGFASLKQIALQKVNQGITSMSEVNRVIQI